MQMTHDRSFFASFGEQNSRIRFRRCEFLPDRTGKRPATANVRALNCLRKEFLQRKMRQSSVLGLVLGWNAKLEFGKFSRRDAESLTFTETGRERAWPRQRGRPLR